MRIVVEFGTHLRNHGDNAMLVVAVRRFQRLWPDARIQVVAAGADAMTDLLPNVSCLTAEDRAAWRLHLLTRIRRRFSWVPSGRSLQAIERTLQQRFPRAGRLLMHSARDQASELMPRALGFAEAIAESDLVFGAGGGGITDAFPGYAFHFLSMLHAGNQAGAVTACMGQGIGPLTDPALTALARRALPGVCLIGVRERLLSTARLRALGVRADRIVVTGDDAIELAYEARRIELADGLGFNLRVTDYSGINDDESRLVSEVIARWCAHGAVPLVPIPIERGVDEEAIRPVMAAAMGRPVDVGADLRSLSQLFAQIARCRVVVSGSYHGALFALAQGIPAVGLAKSSYYCDKFHGLAAQFGDGCHVIDLHGPAVSARLDAALANLWHAAPALRPTLLAAARRQLDDGYRAYARLGDIVEHHRVRRSVSA